MGFDLLILIRTQRISQISTGFHVKCSSFLLYFNQTYIFSTNFRKIFFIKIRPVGAEFFRADRQTVSQTDRQTDRQRDGKIDRQSNRQTDSQTDRHRQTDGQIDRQTDSQSDRQTDR